MSRLLQVTFICSLVYRSLLNDRERKAICGGEFNKYFLKISVLSIGRYGIEIKCLCFIENIRDWDRSSKDRYIPEFQRRKKKDVSPLQRTNGSLSGHQISYKTSR